MPWDLMFIIDLETTKGFTTCLIVHPGGTSPSLLA